MNRSPMPPRKKGLQRKAIDKTASARRRAGARAKADLSALEREEEAVSRSALKRGKPLRRRAVAVGSKASKVLHYDGTVVAVPRKVAGGIPDDVRAEVKQRSGGWCEASWEGVCPPGRHRAQHVHHVILRSQGGPDVAWNLLHICLVVHRHAHDVDRAGAESRGIIRRRAAR